MTPGEFARRQATHGKLACAVGTVLRRWRLKAGMSLEALASQMETSPGAVRRMERGTHDQRVGLIQTWATVTNAHELEAWEAADQWMLRSKS